jgi:hypothetical protein
MSRLCLALGCLLGLTPVGASAAVYLQIGSNAGADAVDAVVAPGSGEHFFDLTFNETGGAWNDHLYAYDLFVEVPRPGISLLRVEKPDNWVFTAPDATLQTLEAELGHIVAVGVDSRTGTGSDITTGSKAARVIYLVDDSLAPGVYRIVLRPEWTVFGSGNPECSCPIFADVSDPGVVLVTPEPSSLGLLALGLLGLRRRRAS